ncbi:MAG TPA: fasciclin domain-containing protein [Sphingomicrobium sp.]|nr:fasciclin domain-containing protein [Sphingomicrobium sp.]
MRTRALALGIAAAALVATGGCDKSRDKNENGPPEAQTRNAQKIAGTKTIAGGLAPTSRFMVAAKAAGLDQALAGPGPYTVFMPDDAAFNSAPAGTFDPTPQNRGQITGVMANLILPGTVMVTDIDKAIDNRKGQTKLATMGGGTLTAAREGDKTVLTDTAGHKATITQPDEQYTNGVVHHINALLLPSKTPKVPAAGQKRSR